MHELIIIIIISCIITLIMSIRLTYIIDKLKCNDNNDLLKLSEFIASIITLIQIINIAVVMLLILDNNSIKKVKNNKIITTDSSCVFTPNVEIIKKIEYKK